MIIFVEGNKVDISEFINGFKSSIAFIGDKLRINLDVVKDKIKVIEEMHRIMCEQDKKNSVLKEKLDSGREDESSCDTTLKKKNEILKRNVKVAEENYANIKLKYDSLVDQVRELRSLNLEKAEKILNLEVEKKRLYDELQLEKATRRVSNATKNLVKGDEVGKRYLNPTFVEDAYIPSDAIIPKEVIAGIIFERPKFL
jgi:hypothetical protein